MKISIEQSQVAGEPFALFMSGFEGDDNPFDVLPRFPDFLKIFGEYLGEQV